MPYSVGLAVSAIFSSVPKIGARKEEGLVRKLEFQFPDEA